MSSSNNKTRVPNRIRVSFFKFVHEYAEILIFLIGLLIIPFVSTSGMTNVFIFIALVLSVAVVFLIERKRGYEKSCAVWQPHYEKWKKTLAEMGFHETSQGVMGRYRNHGVKIDSIEVEGGEFPYHLTRYGVDFENRHMLFLFIRRALSHPLSYYSLFQKIYNPTREGYDRDLEFSSPQLEGLIIKGNKEDEIRSILDSSIQNRLRNIKDNLCSLEIGYGHLSGIDKVEIKPNGVAYIDSRSLSETLRMELMPNVLHYIDFRSYAETVLNLDSFQYILDTLIDIVERIESYTPPV